MKLALGLPQIDDLLARTRSLFVRSLRSYGGESRIPLGQEWLRVTLAIWVLGRGELAPETLHRTATEENFRDRGAHELALALTAFFLRLLAWIELRSGFRDDIADPRAQARYLQRDVDDSEYIQASTRVVCAFVHQAGVDPGLKLHDFFDPARTTEPLLHITQPWYRDHFWHALDVLILGLLILRTNRDGRSWTQRISDGSKGTKRPLAQGAITKNWCIAALFHDVGYGVAALPQILPEAALFRSPEVDRLVEQVHRSIADGTGSFNDGITVRLNEIGGINLPPLRELDHGLVSFSQLLFLIDNLPTHDLLRPSLAWALEAVALHNISDHPIVVRANPIAALLLICDELQEWHRERIDCSDLKRHIVADVLFPAPHRLYRMHLVQDAWLNIELTDTGDLKQHDTELHAEIEYVSPDSGRYLPQYVWLTRTRALQRLGWSKPPPAFPDIRITTHHPYDYRLRALRDEYEHRRLNLPTELDLLFSFALEQGRRAFIEPWQESMDARQRSVEHSPGDESERLSLNLPLLNTNNRKPVQCQLGELLDGFAEWRDYQLAQVGSRRTPVP